MGLKQNNMSDIMKKDTHEVSVFSDLQAFEQAQRIAKGLSSSDLVPDIYKNNIANTMVALEMSYRMNLPPMMVMQNLFPIEGKPSWSSSFVIGRLRTTPSFTSVKFVIENKGKKKATYSYWDGPKGQRTKKEGSIEIDEMTCYVLAKDREGNDVKGSTVSISMAVAEGWYTKPGSKWPTMPEQMLQYRAATFFARIHAPEVLFGYPSADEVRDTQDVQETIDTTWSEVTPHNQIKTPIDRINQKIENSSVSATEARVSEPVIADAAILPDDGETNWI